MFFSFFFLIDPDSEIVVFAKRTVKDLKLPPVFITHIASSIQASQIKQLTKKYKYKFFAEKNQVLQFHFIICSNVLVTLFFSWLNISRKKKNYL